MRLAAAARPDLSATRAAVRSHPQKFFRKALLQDLGYYFISGLVPGLLLPLPLSVLALGAHAIVPHRMQAAVAAWPLWQRILVGLVVGEVGFYWGHRWSARDPLPVALPCHPPQRRARLLPDQLARPSDRQRFIRLCGLMPAYMLGVASPLTPTGSLVPVLIVLIAPCGASSSTRMCAGGSVRWNG